MERFDFVLIPLSRVSTIGCAHAPAPRRAAQSLIVLTALLAAGCGRSELNYPSRDEVIRTAAACGVPDFEPTPAGVGIAAYVPKSVPDAKAKEDCIYDSIRGRGYLLTR